MTVQDDRQVYEGAYARRSDLTWFIDPEGEEAKVRDWSRKTLVVVSSPEYGELITQTFDHIEHRHCYIPSIYRGEITEYFAGAYRGAKMSVMHLGITPGAQGGSYMDMALERLRNGPCESVVVVGELSALQGHVQIGDLVLATGSIKDDDIYQSYPEWEEPSEPDGELSELLFEVATQTKRTTHRGICWSCGAGAGMYDPALVDITFEHYKNGILGNALEAATAYTLGKIMDIKIASLWLVADSMFETIRWKRPSPRLAWESGWQDLIRAGLQALAALGKDEPTGTP
jgi:uridine phosphorylase